MQSIFRPAAQETKFVRRKLRAAPGGLKTGWAEPEVTSKQSDLLQV
jgi:hypothetical protein